MTTSIATPEPMSLIQLALERDASPELLERLVALQERVERTRATTLFGQAMAGFQSEMRPVLKTRAVLNRDRTERYRFASYDDIFEAVGPLLSKYNISVSFEIPTTSDRFNMTLRLRVGGYFEDKMYSAPMPDTAKLAGQLYMTEPQAFGVALSYHKRYCLCAALNIVVTDEDSDAAAQDLAAPITVEQLAEIRELLVKSKKTESGLCHWLNVGELEAMTRADYDKATFYLKTSTKGKS